MASESSEDVFDQLIREENEEHIRQKQARAESDRRLKERLAALTAQSVAYEKDRSDQELERMERQAAFDQQEAARRSAARNAESDAFSARLLAEAKQSMEQKTAQALAQMDETTRRTAAALEESRARQARDSAAHKAEMEKTTKMDKELRSQFAESRARIERQRREDKLAHDAEMQRINESRVAEAAELQRIRQGIALDNERSARETARFEQQFAAQQAAASSAQNQGRKSWCSWCKAKPEDHMYGGFKCKYLKYKAKYLALKKLNI